MPFLFGDLIQRVRGYRGESPNSILKYCLFSGTYLHVVDWSIRVFKNIKLLHFLLISWFQIEALFYHCIAVINKETIQVYRKNVEKQNVNNYRKTFLLIPFSQMSGREKFHTQPWFQKTSIILLANTIQDILKNYVHQIELRIIRRVFFLRPYYKTSSSLCNYLNTVIYVTNNYSR